MVEGVSTALTSWAGEGDSPESVAWPLEFNWHLKPLPGYLGRARDPAAPTLARMTAFDVHLGLGSKDARTHQKSAVVVNRDGSCRDSLHHSLEFEIDSYWDSDRNPGTAAARVWGLLLGGEAVLGLGS